MIDSLSRGCRHEADVDEKDAALLEFVELLTLRPAQNTDADVAKLRAAGWNDAQIAEAVYIIALFAFFNRVADGFGLQDPKYRELAAAGTTAHLPKNDVTGGAIVEPH